MASVFHNLVRGGGLQHVLPVELLTCSLLPTTTRLPPPARFAYFGRSQYRPMPTNGLLEARIGKSGHRQQGQSRATMATTSDSKRKNKEKVLILGSGWAGYILSRQLSPDKYDVTVVSPRSYFVFTPLLNDTAVGALEFPHVIEPVRDRKTSVNFVQAWARKVDVKKRIVFVEGSVTDSGVTEAAAAGEIEDKAQGKKPRTQRIAEQEEKEAKTMELSYDKLVISVGCISQTFGTPGVRDNALFLKDIGDARKIKRRILECFELAAMPNCSAADRKWLLNFVAVGGGPTGMEFAAVLSDLIHEDMEKVYPSLRGHARVTVYDVAPKVLSMFDDALSKYAADTMKKQGIDVKTKTHIQELRWGRPNTESSEEWDPKGPLTMKIKEEGEVGVGMCVWTTGNAMNPFIEHGLNGVGEASPGDLLVTEVKKGERGVNHEGKEWQVKKHEKTGALLVDDHLRIQLTVDTGTTASVKNIFALGDNALIESGAPPATAQTANQEARWLAQRLNNGDMDKSKGFEFNNKGLLTYVGDSKGLVQTPERTEKDSSSLQAFVPDAIRGKAAYAAWKGAYWSMSISWRNRVLILVYWAVNYVFGRDISRF